MLSTLNFALKACMYITGITLCVSICVIVLGGVIVSLYKIASEEPRRSKWD